MIEGEPLPAPQSRARQYRLRRDERVLDNIIFIFIALIVVGKILQSLFGRMIGSHPDERCGRTHRLACIFVHSHRHHDCGFCFFPELVRQLRWRNFAGRAGWLVWRLWRRHGGRGGGGFGGGGGFSGGGADLVAAAHRGDGK